MLTVLKIHWTSIPAQEADVTVAAGSSECTAFCQPCRYEVGDRVAEPLHIFGLKRAMISSASPHIEKVGSSGLGQRGAGRVVDLAHAKISVEDLQLVFDDPLPRGLAVGDIVEFECARIDLW